MSALHTPAPRRASMLGLRAMGYAVRECWFGDQYDGLVAVKRVGDHCVEVYSGNADDGEYTDLHYPAVVYVDDSRIAGDMSVERAVRVAELRVRMLRAAITAATGGHHP